MSILEWCERIQGTGVGIAIRESTWGYPIVGALHVLAIALFGGAVLMPDVRWFRRVGLTLVVSTGTLLFVSSAVRYYESTAFRVKMLLLVLLALNAFVSSRQYRRKLHFAISLALWAAVIFASRGIAFF